LSFIRSDRESGGCVLVVLNLTPTLHRTYRIGLPRPGRWSELLNSDATVYGGSNQGNAGGLVAESIACHGQPQSAEFVLPPLSVCAFRVKGQ
jgi:1,4-alpha-glucan branching enzyme